MRLLDPVACYIRSSAPNVLRIIDILIDRLCCSNRMDELQIQARKGALAETERMRQEKREKQATARVELAPYSSLQW